jgi:hypothetical protein
LPEGFGPAGRTRIGGIRIASSLRAELHFTAMYGTNFNLKIFTDITMPVIKYGIGYIGKSTRYVKF